MLSGSRGPGPGNREPGGDRGSGVWGAGLGLMGILLLALAAFVQSVSVVPAGAARTSSTSVASPANTTPVELRDAIASDLGSASVGLSAEGMPDGGSERAETGSPGGPGPPACSGTETPAHTAVSTSGSTEIPKAGGSKGEYPLQANPLAGCTLCHVDIEDEFLGSLHFEEKVGCATCHGPSEGHLADENNEVKPDEMFARADVDRLCERCHECFRPASEKPELTPEGDRKVCTDCHGSHDLALVDKGSPSKTP